MLIKTDALGNPIFSNKDLVDMIYTGHINKCHAVLCEPTDTLDQFNKSLELNGFAPVTKYIIIDTDQTEFDKALQSEYFMPEEYRSIDVVAFLSNKINDNDNLNRLMEELFGWKEHEMFDIIRYMIYLVDFMRENNIVWGVGRGSSVSSYVLYLIGVHKIDPIKYELDWREFLR